MYVITYLGKPATAGQLAEIDELTDTCEPAMEQYFVARTRVACVSVYCKSFSSDWNSKPISIRCQQLLGAL